MVRLTIKTKLTGVILTLTTLIAVLVTVSIYVFQGARETEAIENRTATLAKMLAAGVSAGLEFDDADAVKKAIEAARENKEVIFVEVAGKDGNTVASFLADDYSRGGRTLDSYRGSKSVFTGRAQVMSDIGSGELGQVRVALSDRVVVDAKASSLKIGLQVALVISLIGAITALWLGQNITAPIREMGSLMQKLADGDFSQGVQVASNDEIRDLADNVNRMIESTRTLIAKIVDASTLLNTTSSDISSAASALSRSADSQNRMSTEAASTVEELASSAQSVFSFSKDTSAQSAKAQESAGHGLSAIGPAMGAMTQTQQVVNEADRIIDGLKRKSEDIAQIISIIKDIASQTNLLALNAAIEAARAGEHGRGFEVVAQEVRKLAESSSSSSSQIEGIIDALQKDSRQAVASMDKIREELAKSSSALKNADESFKSIASAVEETTSFSSQMLSLSEDQARSSSQTASRLEKILTETRSIGTQSQQLSHTVDELTRASTNLRELMTRFRV